MRKVKVLLALICIILPVCFTEGLCESQVLPADVAEALEKAGENRAELEKVLAHYQTRDDSLKLKAAYFLVGNMEDHCYVSYMLCDTSGAELDFDVLDYPDFDALLAAFDSLEELYGPLDFERKDKVYDLEAISFDLLVENIDYAFKAWKEKPWAQDLSFEQFCQYILPHRGSNEPLESWRRVFWEKYANVADNLENPEDPIEVAAKINDDIKTWFGFDPRYYYHPTDLGLSEMLETGLGRCEDMTNLTIYAMRANGLAVTSDYTPYWANTGNNHAWNAIVLADGRSIPFMGAESNPGRYKLANLLAKAYRKTYSKQYNNLIFQERKQESVPGWLGGKYYTDVTSSYTNVASPIIKFSKEIPDSVDIAYICVFNSGKWKAIEWARINNGSAEFTDLGTDIVYLPALYMNEEIVPYAPPVILREDGTLEEIQADQSRTSAVELKAITFRKQVISTDGIGETSLNPGDEYELFYWEEGWKSLGRKMASDKPLIFENVPKGGLYWLTAVGSDNEERIFTIEDRQQIWW